MCFVIVNHCQNEICPAELSSSVGKIDEVGIKIPEGRNNVEQKVADNSPQSHVIHTSSPREMSLPQTQRISVKAGPPRTPGGSALKSAQQVAHRIQQTSRMRAPGSTVYPAGVENALDVDRPPLLIYLNDYV